MVRDPVLATALFRIVQEALNNVVRHAHARNVWIDLQSEETDLILRVRDDGKGMAVTTGHPGMGLSSMRERARAVGGRLEIVSAPGDGCCVALRLEIAALPCRPRPAMREESTA
jgi:signal transduction histidine kinase